MSSHLYWIGIRESELKDVQGLFAGSITVFGSGQNGNRAFEQQYHIRYDYNQDSDAWNRFVMLTAKEIVLQDPDCRFLLYSPDEVELYGSVVAERTICQNHQALLKLLGNKFLTRQWFSDYVPILEYKMQYGASLNFYGMQQAFSGYENFVVQSSSSCGGSGTWLLTEDNQEQILPHLEQEALYAISPYQENNISPNVHILIYAEGVLVLPPSIQLITPGRHGLSYQGADFSSYDTLPVKISNVINDYALRIGHVLSRAGYRGVCGIDFLVSDGIVYLMEVNARFQSSTFLINRALREAEVNCSIQSLHMAAFQQYEVPEFPKNFFVPYSFFHYSYEPEQKDQLLYIWRLSHGLEGTECVDDGLDWTMPMEPHTYLYKLVFHGGICAISPEFRCRIHANIGMPTEIFTPQELCHNLERLKYMLLLHGTRLSNAAAAMLMKTGGFNHEEFEALDIVLAGHVYVCVPYDTDRTELSPFCVEVDANNSYNLFYFGTLVTNVHVRSSDPLSEKKTRHGILYRDITYLSNDRLRVYQRLSCYYKDRGLGCRFCDIEQDNRIITLEDIFQAVDDYQSHPKVRHYLIGGGSTSPDDDFETVAAIAKHIHDTTGKPIYLMSLPPKTIDILKKLKTAGITEVAFNMEVFDRERARQYMPGKGTIPLSTYEAAFHAAVQLWGKEGNVRTIFIVGLEPVSSLLQGIEYAASLGVSPILSLFRPATGTPLQRFLPPSDGEIWDICQQAKKICKKYGVELGPACPFCEDNTLKITL